MFWADERAICGHELSFDCASKVTKVTRATKVTHCLIGPCICHERPISKSGVESSSRHFSGRAEGSLLLHQHNLHCHLAQHWRQAATWDVCRDTKMINHGHGRESHGSGWEIHGKFRIIVDVLLYHGKIKEPNGEFSFAFAMADDRRVA